MKDSRFIELINLYVDRQITAAEATELEAEMQSNPRRRGVYRQYCQMQRATTLVYESFRTNTPAGQSDVVPARATVARFEPHRELRSPGRWTYCAAGLAAACLAVAVVRLNFHRAPDGTLAVVAPQASPPASAAPVPAAGPRAIAEPRAGLVSLRNNPAGEQDYAAMVASLRQQEQRTFAATQARVGPLPSLFEDGVFDQQQQVFPAGNQRTFRSKQAPAPQAEFTAFQFQR